MLLDSDRPLTAETQDELGISDFAVLIARAIQRTTPDTGVVLALEGPWGSGKSSIVELVAQRITADSKTFAVNRFNPWWFSDDNDLVLAFFTELASALDVPGHTILRDKLVSFGLSLSKVMAPVAAMALSGGLISGPTAAITESFGSLLRQLDDRKSVEKRKNEISEILASQRRRFLIVIDDLDRLAPKDIAAIIRLVKSVGDLPRVTYLLVFDPTIVANSLQTYFSLQDGAAYLEKIVQLKFSVPVPHKADLTKILVRGLNSVSAEKLEIDEYRWTQVLHEDLHHMLRTPRDVRRILNAITIMLDHMGKDINLIDMVLVEAIRILYPRTYELVRRNGGQLTGTGQAWGDHKKAEKFYEKLKESIFGEENPILENTLIRLFPRLGKVWSNHQLHSTVEIEWRKSKRVCSEQHFESYFRFSPDENSASTSEVTSFLSVANADNASYEEIKEILLALHKKPRGRGLGNRLEPFLETLSDHVEKLSPRAQGILIASLIDIGDMISDSDSADGVFFTSNYWRMENLIRVLVSANPQDVRAQAIANSFREEGSLALYIHLIMEYSCEAGVIERFHNRRKPDPLLDEESARHLVKSGREAIEKAARDGTLKTTPQLAYILYRWRDFGGEEEVKAWVDKLLMTLDGIVLFAKAMTGTSTFARVGQGEIVSGQRPSVNVQSIAALTDSGAFIGKVRAALIEVTDSSMKATLGRFIQGLGEENDET